MKRRLGPMAGAPFYLDHDEERSFASLRMFKFWVALTYPEHPERSEGPCMLGVGRIGPVERRRGGAPRGPAAPSARTTAPEEPARTSVATTA